MERIVEEEEGKEASSMPLTSDGFRRSLRELKDISSQLYNAAHYCETSFLKSAQKKLVINNTKSYISDAIVTVVDHLGTVSSSLDDQITGSIKILETEQKIQSLNQRLLSCQQHAFSLDLSAVYWRTRFLRHCKHYVVPHHKSYAPLRNNNADIEVLDKSYKEQLKELLGFSTFDSGTEVGPAFESMYVSSKTHDISIGTMKQGSQTPPSYQKKYMQGARTNFLSFFRSTSKRRA